MPLKVIRKTYLPTGNLLLRLNASDTRFFLKRIEEAIEKGAGANLILLNTRTAICEIETAEHGREVTINAYSNEMSSQVRTEQNGYRGQWSHAEIVMPLAAIKALKVFAGQGVP